MSVWEMAREMDRLMREAYGDEAVDAMYADLKERDEAEDAAEAARNKSG